MHKNVTKLETKINGRDYLLYCEMDSPIPDAKEAVFHFIKYLGQVEDAIKKAQEAQEAQKAEVSPIEIKPGDENGINPSL